MSDIGQPRREYIVEPMPEAVPEPEVVPAEPEKVPA